MNIGAITGMIGTYIGDSVNSAFFDQDKEVFSDLKQYYGNVIAGFFSAAILVNTTSIFLGVMAAVAVNKGITYVINEYFGIKTENLLRDFIFDTILIYYIILILKKILEMLDVQESEDEFIGIEELVTTATINIYFVIKRNLRSNRQKKFTQNI